MKNLQVIGALHKRGRVRASGEVIARRLALVETHVHAAKTRLQLGHDTPLARSQRMIDRVEVVEQRPVLEAVVAALPRAP